MNAACIRAARPLNFCPSCYCEERSDEAISWFIEWLKALGGVDKGINLYTRDEASGTREVFWQMALDQKEIASKANVVVSNGAMKSAVAGDPYGIGYVSVGHIDQTVAPVAMDGISPTLANVKEPVSDRRARWPTGSNRR